MWKAARTRRSLPVLLAEYGEFGCSGDSSVNRPVAPETAVDLVGTDVHEAVDPPRAADVEHDLGAEHVGVDEGGRVHDRPVDVALGREVHDAVGRVCFERGLDGRPITDVGPHEGVVRIRLDLAQILEVASVGQHVEVHDSITAFEQQTNEVRADEAGTAGDEDLAHFASSSR